MNENTERKITKAKQQYLTNEQFGTPLLKATSLPNVAEYYESKYGIEIFLNGCSEYAKQRAEEIKNSSSMPDELRKRVNHFNDVNFKFAESVIDLFENKIDWYEYNKNKIDKDNKYYDYLIPIKACIEKYYKNKYKGTQKEEWRLKCFDMRFDSVKKKALWYSEEDIKGLNVALRQLCKEEPKLKTFLENKIDEQKEIDTKELMKEVARYENPIIKSSDDISREILEIQHSLKEDEYVGYIFTNGNNPQTENYRNDNHFEIIIIGKTDVYKPVNWRVNFYREIHSDHTSGIEGNFFTTHYHGLPFSSDDKDSTKLFYAQAGTEECATLGLLYIKELLKNNAKQLREYTLKFPYCDKDGNIEWVFITSPQTLRYSQSSSFNKMMKAMIVSDESSCKITSSKTTVTITPIKQLIKNSIENLRKTNKNSEQVEKLSNLLDNFESFRTKWLAKYERQMQKRETMQQDSWNRYLAYKVSSFDQVELKNVANEFYEKVYKGLTFVKDIKSWKDVINVANNNGQLEITAKNDDYGTVAASWLDNHGIDFTKIRGTNNIVTFAIDESNAKKFTDKLKEFKNPNIMKPTSTRKEARLPIEKTTPPPQLKKPPPKADSNIQCLHQIATDLASNIKRRNKNVPNTKSKLFETIAKWLKQNSDCTTEDAMSLLFRASGIQSTAATFWKKADSRTEFKNMVSKEEGLADDYDPKAFRDKLPKNKDIENHLRRCSYDLEKLNTFMEKNKLGPLPQEPEQRDDMSLK